MNDTIKAILFDLDGTLLDQMDAFLPHYFQFQALAACVAHILPPEGPKAKAAQGWGGPSHPLHSPPTYGIITQASTVAIKTIDGGGLWI